MKLSILIVNWNTRDLAVRCINSIVAHAPVSDYEVILVDNNSSDGSVDTLVTLFAHRKNIKIIPSLRNWGFAKGNNIAFRQSFGEYVLLLNPDTEIRDGALQKMVQYMDSHTEVAVVGPKLINPDGSLQPSVRRFPGIWSSVSVFSGLHRLFRPRGYLMDKFDYHTAGEVDQVMGAAFLTRRKVIEQIGFLDENFWLWYEEVDFCKRVKKSGGRIMYFPDATIMHEGAQSFAQLAVYSRKRIAARSLIYYFQKNGHVWETWMIRVLIPTVLFLAKGMDYLQKVFRFKLRPHV